MNVTGDTMTGALVLAADPLANLEAATKQYVDTAVASVVAVPGGTSGQLQFNNAGVFGGANFMGWDDVNTCLSIGSNIVTANQPVLFLGQGWNNAAVSFKGFQVWMSSS